MILKYARYQLNFRQLSLLLLVPLAMTGFMAGLATPAKAYVYELVLRHSDLVRNGREALRDGQIEVALGLYQQALDNGLSEIELPRVHGEMCVAHYFLRQYGEALDHCTASIRLLPNTWVTYNNRGNVYLEAGRYDLARADYEKAMQLNPGSEVLARNMELVTYRQQARIEQ